ncbi:MAG TPA: 5,6-dimethylbenzimidazole synthase [Mesorhizobium sp.]
MPAAASRQFSNGNSFDRAAQAAVYRAIFTRRDVRSHFLPDAINDAVLARLLLAAHHAPSVGYMQPWNFIVIRDDARRRQVRQLFVEARQIEGEQMQGDRHALYRSLKLEGICETPLNLVVTCDRSRAKGSPLGRWHNPQMDLFSTVCAVQNFWLAARAEGIGVGWVSILDGDALKRLLDIPDHVVPVAYLCVGHVSGFGSKPDLETHGWGKRLPLADLVMSEKFAGTGEDGLKDAVRAMTSTEVLEPAGTHEQEAVAVASTIHPA